MGKKKTKEKKADDATTVLDRVSRWAFARALWMYPVQKKRKTRKKSR